MPGGLYELKLYGRRPKYYLRHNPSGYDLMSSSAGRSADVPNVAAQPAMRRVGVQPRVPEQ
jgi:hypothetical protein